MQHCEWIFRKPWTNNERDLALEVYNKFTRLKEERIDPVSDGYPLHPWPKYGYAGVRCPEVDWFTEKTALPKDDEEVRYFRLSQDQPRMDAMTVIEARLSSVDLILQNCSPLKYADKQWAPFIVFLDPPEQFPDRFWPKQYLGFDWTKNYGVSVEAKGQMLRKTVLEEPPEKCFPWRSSPEPFAEPRLNQELTMKKRF